MKLTYRSSKYQLKSHNIARAESNLFATFLGRPYCIYRTQYIPEVMVAVTLTYRGTQYQSLV